MNKALFLDRDGTLIEHVPYLSDPQAVRLISGVKEALHKAIQAGYLLFLFTNQSGVGRGWFTMEAVEACNNRMLELLDLPSPGFTAICIAPEAPEAPIIYRKPSPRFILESIAYYNLSIQESYMIGDALSDVEAAQAAGIHSVAVGGLTVKSNGMKQYAGLPAFIKDLLG